MVPKMAAYPPRHLLAPRAVELFRIITLWIFLIAFHTIILVRLSLVSIHRFLCGFAFIECIVLSHITLHHNLSNAFFSCTPTSLTINNCPLFHFCTLLRLCAFSPQAIASFSPLSFILLHAQNVLSISIRFCHTAYHKTATHIVCM